MSEINEFGVQTTTPISADRRTREVAMQMAIHAFCCSGLDASELVNAAKAIGDFLEGKAG